MVERGNEQLIEVEQIRLVYRNTVRTPVGLILLLAMLTYLFGSELASPWPYAWSAAVLLLHGARSWMIFRALRASPSDAALLAHMRRTRAMTTAMGALIAAGMLAFVPPLTPGTEALATMVCIGWLAGVVGVFGPYPRYIRPWFVLFGGSLSIVWLARGSAESSVVSLLIALLVFFLWMTISDIGRKAVEAIRIRFENVELLEALKVRQQALEEASATKSRFMRAASHDLRQPLMSIALLKDAVLDAPTLDEARHAARRLAAPIESLEGTLDSLADIARLETGAVQPRPVPTSLAALARLLGDEFAPRVAGTPVALDVTGDDTSVVVDAHLLARVVSNLLDNAIKFTRRGRIAATLRRAGERVEIVVEDTGVGIADADLPRVFDEYFQGDTRGASSKGLGLGLSIVRRIVAILGGDVHIESRPGAGTSVRLSVPAPAATGAPSAKAATVAVTADRAAAPRSLLFVDDDADVQDAVAAWASGAGLSATFAESAEAALAISAAWARAPDVVVTDFRLPGIDGLALVARLRERWPSLPAILVTGEPDPTLRGRAAAAGVGFLAKPVDGARLGAAIRHAYVPGEAEAGR